MPDYIPKTDNGLIKKVVIVDDQGEPSYFIIDGETAIQ